MEESLSFEEFYCSWLTLEQNTEIFQRILKSEHFAHLFSKEDMEEIKTKEDLGEKYNNILSRARGLMVDEQQIRKAEELLLQANQRKNSVKKLGSPKRTSFLFFKMMIK